MRQLFEFKSVRSRLTFWFMMVAIMPLLIFFGVVFEMRVEKLKEKELDKLCAIRDLKADQINGWLDSNTADIENIAGIHQFKRFLEEFHNNREYVPDPTVVETVQRRLEQYSTSFLAFSELSILHPETGVVLVSSTRALEGQNKSSEPCFQEVIRTAHTYIQDITYSSIEHRAIMSASTPIRCFKHDNEHLIGVLVARIDLNHSLYRLLKNRTGLGITGETYIVSRDGLALSELRWHEGATLKIKLQSKQLQHAIDGGTGAMEAEDYRGESVLAAYTSIPRLGWGFVTKQDLKEVSSEIREMTLHMLSLLGLSIVGVIAIGFLVARSIAKPVIDMAQVSQTIESGDLSARNTVQAPDELGYLAQTFNGMAESVQKQLAILQGIAELNQVMMAARDLNEFYTTLLDKLIDLTESDQGACYKYAHEGNRFDPAGSVGLSPQHLEPFSAEHREGQFGKALAAKQMYHATAIPENTAFTFKTIVGTALPREIVTVPIVVKDRAQLVLSLASLAGYSDHQLKIVEHVSTGIATALSNLMANEETVRLASELQLKNAQLKAQADELLMQAKELEQQSAELHQQNVELEMQRRQVEEASRLKSTFLSNMSHELRTPLNSVMALSKVLMMDEDGKLSQEELGYLEIIERNGRKLLSLINDILDLSKIEAGKVDLNVDKLSPAAVIRNVVERLQPLAEAKGLELVQDIPEYLPEVESDEGRLDQIIQNLIGNAVKFTDKGRITVYAGGDQNRVEIRVADTGIGIHQSELPHIFEEFRQADGSPSRRHEGTGLGLAIANKTAGLLKSRLTVESTYGKGSTFTLSVPTRWAGDTPPLVPFFLKNANGVERGGQPVLIVDDDPAAIEMIAGCLAEEGYPILKATSGKEALRLAEVHRPLAVTLDIIMPGMDGWEVLQALKANPKTADIPVLIVSISDDRATGVALGAVGFVTKPVMRQSLIEEIRKLGGITAGDLIMVVDDNEIDRREMTRMIEREGMSAISAESGARCLEILKKTRPDVLVLDLMMPDMDGFQVLDRLRKDPGTMALSVIIVTAKDLTAEDRAVLSGQVNSVLAKSHMMPKALLEEIKKVLAQIRRSAFGMGEPQALAGQRILMVEDNETAVIQVKTVLEREGYLVDVARGGKEAIEYVRHTIPDGIILDLMMPEIDGFQVLQEIRSSRATSRIPVLVLTAKDLTTEDLGKLSANHIQQLVQKGDVDAERLLFKIGLMLGGKPEPKRHARSEWKTENAVGGCEKHKSASKSAETKSGSPTVLVVEDNPDNMATIRAILKNRYQVIEAGDGEDGLAKALSDSPDLILLDMALPKMDGFAVLRELRAHGKARLIPVIALTARAMKGDREQILRAGFDDYISKPIEPDELTRKIALHLKGDLHGQSAGNR